MKYYCTGCGYVYDERNGELDVGIVANTFYEDLPNDFFCPMCDTHKDDFVLLEEYIHVPFLDGKITLFEAEHIPVYQLNGDKLSVEVGNIDHPMEEEHYISRILLLDDSGSIIDEKRFKVGEIPQMIFDIEYLDEFEIRVCCSRDGIFSTGKIKRP